VATLSGKPSYTTPWDTTQSYAFEVLASASDAAGVTLRFPFYDRRLVQFCLAMPSSEKLAHGYPRAMLRNAMAGHIPEQVRLRRDKYDFTAQLASGLARHADQLLDELAVDRASLSTFVDLDVARRSIIALKDPRHRGTAHLFPAWRTAMLLRWLEHRARASTSVETLSLLTKAA